MRRSGLLVALLTAALPGAALAQTTLVLESWRDDDRTAWQEEIVPAFETAHPGIRLRFRPSAPFDYDAGLSARLRAGTAGEPGMRNLVLLWVELALAACSPPNEPAPKRVDPLHVFLRSAGEGKRRRCPSLDAQPPSRSRLPGGTARGR